MVEDIQETRRLHCRCLPDGRTVQGGGNWDDNGLTSGTSPVKIGRLSLAHPSPTLPLADVVVHIQAEDLAPQSWAGKVAEVASQGGDVGPVLLPDIARLLGHFRVRVIPVIDQNGDLESGTQSRREHRAKTAGLWTVSQPVQGLYVWISPTGQRLAVINGHTHRLPDV